MSANGEASKLGLDGAVCLVTGAASGIGRAVARRLLAEGAKVMATDRNVAALEATRDLLEGDAERLQREGLDVTRPRDWERALETLELRFGPIEVLVQAAGVCSPRSILEEELAHWRASFEVNVEGVMLGMRHAAPIMVRAGRGAIINVASASGIRAAPGASAYSASKAAVRMLTRTAALELAPRGVRVNSVSPGGVATPMWSGQPWWPEHVQRSGSEEAAWEALASETPIGRFAEASEIAEAIVWLASPRASFAVGEDLVLDGGFTIV